MNKKQPLVSCIMPTFNRPEFITNAIHQFFHQNYPNKELIIVDDGQKSIADLVPDSVLIKYLRLDRKQDLGTKRNLACEAAKGEIIIHLDDDDYYAPDWLLKQVSFLIEKKLDITGLATPVFYHKAKDHFWQYVYPDKKPLWVYGATLCYTKNFWRNNPFQPISHGEDNAFVWSRNAANILAHDAVTSYLGLIHNHNTSQKQLKDKRWHKLENSELVITILDSHKII